MHLPLVPRCCHVLERLPVEYCSPSHSPNAAWPETPEVVSHNPAEKKTLASGPSAIFQGSFFLILPHTHCSKHLHVGLILSAVFQLFRRGLWLSFQPLRSHFHYLHFFVRIKLSCVLFLWRPPFPLDTMIWNCVTLVLISCWGSCWH